MTCAFRLPRLACVFASQKPYTSSTNRLLLLGARAKRISTHAERELMQGKQWVRQLRQSGKNVTCAVYPNAAHPLAAPYADYDRWCNAGTYVCMIFSIDFFSKLCFFPAVMFLLKHRDRSQVSAPITVSS